MFALETGATTSAHGTGDTRFPPCARSVSVQDYDVAGDEQEFFTDNSMHTWRQWLAQTPRGTQGSQQWVRGFLSGGFVSASLLLVGIHLAEIPPLSVWVLVTALFFGVCFFRKTLDGAVWLAVPSLVPRRSPRRDGTLASGGSPRATSTVRKALQLLVSPGRRGGSSARGCISDRSTGAKKTSILQGDAPLDSVALTSRTASGDRGDIEASKPGTAKSVDTKFDLPENMWSLAIVCGVGQASFAQSNLPMPTTLALLMCALLWCLQALIIFLIVHDLNEYAAPVTVKSDNPWIHRTWTVNVMKLLMIFFLTANLVNDSHCCADALRACYMVHEHQLTVPRWVIKAVPMLQYSIVLGVAWGGSAVVLSCQDVLSILCNSLSITFIVNADELFYSFFQDSLDLTPDLVVVIEHRPGEEAEDNPERDQKLKTLEKFMVSLPMAMGLFIFVSSCATGRMPTRGLHLRSI